jgi:CspA family cold shock protein
MQRGTVKFFNESKGFGFIKSEESGEDVFVHMSGLVDDIRENDKVQFNTRQGQKGINAVDVEVI